MWSSPAWMRWQNSAVYPGIFFKHFKQVPKVHVLAVTILALRSLRRQDRITPTATSEVVIDTPQYMSPERCRGTPDIDHRTDIYALGCVATPQLAELGSSPDTRRSPCPRWWTRPLRFATSTIQRIPRRSALQTTELKGIIGDRAESPLPTQWPGLGAFFSAMSIWAIAARLRSMATAPQHPNEEKP